MNTTYKFGAMEFTTKEVEMISSLMERYVSGYGLPVKRIGLTKNVIRYALHWKLLEERSDGKLYFPQYSGFNVVYDLPIEVIWRMVQPMLRTDGSTGYSIVNNSQWEKLNIYPQNSRHASDRDLEAKEEILFKLNQHHYIYLQMAGSVWSIYPE